MSDSSNDLYSIAGEAMVIIRKRHLDICDNNPCAAAMLDEFYAYTEKRTEYAAYFIRDRQPTIDDYCTYRTYPQMVVSLFGIYSLEQVTEAFTLLIAKGYIKAWYVGVVGTKQEDMPMKVYCDCEKVQEACEPYYTQIRAEQQKRFAEYQAQEVPNTGTQSQSTPEELEAQRQAQIYHRELSRVQQHLKRAQRNHLPATLTIEEWLNTLEYFKWKCAYCETGEYALLEHFIPLSMDGGTTQGNCVPACHACNGVKKSWHPYQIPFMHTKQAKRFQQGLKRVHEYLVSCGCEEKAPL